LTIVKVLNILFFNISFPLGESNMRLLFITPPMGNWAPWGDRHLAANPLHAQLSAFIREKKAAEGFGLPGPGVE
jgi:hypothetical protein